MFCINDKNYLFEKYPLLQKIHKILQSSPNYYVLNIEFSNYKKNIIIYIKYKGTIISFILNALPHILGHPFSVHLPSFLFRNYIPLLAGIFAFQQKCQFAEYNLF